MYFLLFCIVRDWYRPRTSVFPIILHRRGLVYIPENCILYYFALSGIGTDPRQVYYQFFCICRGCCRPRTRVFYIFLHRPGLVHTPDKCFYYFFAYAGVGAYPVQVYFLLVCIVRDGYRPRTSVLSITLHMPGLVQTPDKCFFQL